MESFKISKEKVKKIMKNRNIKTQTELAKKIGITKSELSRILSPNFDFVKSNIRKFCDLLGISIDEIIEKEKEVEEEKNEEFVDITNVKAKNKYNVVELFAGAGGLALGLEKSGFNTVALVEIDKYASKTLIDNRKKWNVIDKDIVEVASKGIRNYLKNPNEEIDLVSGGYPCQAFSYAGKKLGLDDVRGSMFYYFAEIVKDLNPKVFLAENVRGLVSHDGGRTLKTMIDVYEELGYKVHKKILNSKYYDVPQKRERVVLIGVRKDLLKNKNISYLFPEKYDFIPTLRDYIYKVPKSIGAKYPETKKKVLDLVPPGGCWRDLPEQIAKEYMGKSYYSGGGRTGMARRLSWDEQSLTLTCSPAQKQTERCHPDETRPFTVREYARIQTFPDSWKFFGSMNQQYKQIGNAVPVNLAKAIGLSIIDFLNKL